MKVPYRLRRRAQVEPATALLLPTHASAEVLRLCERLGCDPLPVIYQVADGFLLKLSGPAPGSSAGCVRLRGLSPHLFLPVDADLEPALLPDETAALVRDRGLVFLPGDRVLEFTPDRPLPLAALLTAPVRRASWRSLPQPPPLAERITEVVIESPPEAADEVLQAGGEGIGTEAPPRPPAGGLPGKILGKTAFGLGKGLAWLGHKLGLSGLTGAGASLIAKALALAPQLTEALMGRQEASLRELLRDFEEGNIERALRRALPLSGDSARGTGLSAADHLPVHGVSYSLWDILRGHGSGGLWYSSAETHQRLVNEYRRAAEQAARAGDHRRAAFIYGKLLGEYRRAAAVLAEGGMHRDAAVIYLHKLADPLAAAREYEAAGDVDRALRYYRKCGEHALAGDLLRKAGEEELAIAEYRLAAAKIAALRDGQYKAGELLLTRAKRPDLALAYYTKGWQRRPNDSPVACAIRMAQIYTQQEEVAHLQELVAEAERYLRPEGNDGPAGEFFNEIARLAEQPGLARVQDELRDQALLGIAGKLRQRVAGGMATGSVSALMGAATVWAPAVVSDADFAVKRAGARRPEPSTLPRRAATTQIRAGIPVVTAATWAPGSGEILVGFQSGEVVLFRPQQGEVLPICREDHAITALAISPQGNTVVVLSGAEGTMGYVAGYARNVGYRMTSLQDVSLGMSPLLCPLLAVETGSLAGLWDGQDLRFLRMPQLLQEGRWMGTQADAGTTAGLLLLPRPGGREDTPILDMFLFQRGQIGYARGPVMTSNLIPGWNQLGWEPSLQSGSTLRQAPFAWVPAGPDAIEVAAISAAGLLRWARIAFPDGKLSDVTHARQSLAEPCLAVTLVKPWLLAVVTPKAVSWFRVKGTGFAQTATWPEAFPEAIACFPHQSSNELLIVCGDGTIARIPAPAS